MGKHRGEGEGREAQPKGKHHKGHEVGRPSLSSYSGWGVVGKIGKKLLGRKHGWDNYGR